MGGVHVCEKMHYSFGKLILWPNLIQKSGFLGQGSIFSFKNCNFLEKILFLGFSFKNRLFTRLYAYETICFYRTLTWEMFAEKLKNSTYHG